MEIDEIVKGISPKRVYKLAEAARLVAPAMPAYLFHALVRTKFKAEGNHIGSVRRDLTGAELLEIIHRAQHPASIGARPETEKINPSPSLGVLVGRPSDKERIWARASAPPPTLPEPDVPNDKDGDTTPAWAYRIWDLSARARPCSPSILDQLGRSQKVFAQLPNGKWYIKRQDLVAPSVKPLQGLSYIWELLRLGRPVETCELIHAWTDTVTLEDDDITPFNEFGKDGWSVTRLFDEQKEYNRVCKHFDRGIEAIGKACPELGRYLKLVIERPSTNGEGWILNDHDPGQWVLDATADATDAAMHKVGDSWLLRWLDTEYTVPNDRIGIEYAARILAEAHTGVPCCLLRDSNMADALADRPDIKSLRPILQKHIRRKDCFPSKRKRGVASVVDVLDRKCAEALLEGRIGDSADLSHASNRIKAAVEHRKTRQRLISQIDDLNIHERTQVKKNLDAAIDFLGKNDARQMADHLEQYLKTGEVCHYSGALTWDIRGLSRFPSMFRLASELVLGITHDFL